jgi:hypothetical protein
MTFWTLRLEPFTTGALAYARVLLDKEFNSSFSLCCLCGVLLIKSGGHGDQIEKNFAIWIFFEKLNVAIFGTLTLNMDIWKY